MINSRLIFFYMRSNKEFERLNGISDFVEMLVMTKKSKVYLLLYKLLTLTLILSVATAIVKRVLSIMSIIKDRLHNRMGDQWMNNCKIVYVEKDVFLNINNEIIIQQYQSMKTRKGKM